MVGKLAQKKTTLKKTKEEKPKKEKEIITPEISIGMVGHVDHGKTTLVKALSGIWTDTHSEEIKRGITIKLGYADVSLYKCEKCDEYSKDEKCHKCGKKAKFLRKVSLVDAPGHESLMATMLSGASIIDGALLLVSANEKCPQPQTREHLMALKISGITNVIIVQNKIDTVDEARALENYNQIKGFVKGTEFENSPIIPVSAQQSVNIGELIRAIEDCIPTPKRDPAKDPIMLVARSFDINKPGIDGKNIVGGVLGGALKQGVLNVGDTVEIRPGRSIEERNQKVWKSVITKIVGLKYGNTDVQQAHPGGTFGLLTSLDPAIVKSDSLGGSVLGIEGKLPPLWNELSLKIYLMERVVGVEGDVSVSPINLHEVLMMNINSSSTVGVATEIKKDTLKCRLKLPICAEKGSKITISRRIGDRFRLIGYGIIQ